MSRSLGRTIFVVCIWIYSLIYYLECLDLDDVTEKMTIIAVFWIFTIFVVVELILLVRSILSDPQLKHPFTREGVINIVRDRKTHLAIIIVLYLLAISHLGFYLSSFLAFCSFRFALGTRGLLKLTVPALVVLSVIYLTFSLSLKLSLPQGFFF